MTENINSFAERHSASEIIAMAQKMKMGRLARALLDNWQDQDFLKLDHIEQLYRALTQVQGELETVRYSRNLKKSRIGSSLPSSMELVTSKNDISAADMRQIIDSIVEKRSQPILITGPAGTGKSTLGKNILDRAMHLQRRCVFYDYASAVLALCHDFNEHREAYESRLKELSAYDALMLDDCFMNPNNEYEGNVVRNLLDACRESKCTVIFSTQIPVDDWYRHFKSQFDADAVMDRLTAGPISIKLDCESLRRAAAINIGKGAAAAPAAAAQEGQ